MESVAPTYQVEKVYTPTLPATLTFVDRDSVNNEIVDALGTPGKQIVVFGHSGSGKTTLLHNKLRQTYSDHIVTRCMEDTTFDQLLLEAVDSLNPYYSRVLSDGHENKYALEWRGLGAEIGASTSARTERGQERMLPPQLTPSLLGRLIGSAGMCWVVEDFHKVREDSKRKLAQTMKLFMDMAVDFPGLKIIAIGAAGTARQVVHCEGELKNRVSEVHVPLMNSEELERIIRRGGELLNVRFDPSVQRGIVAYSSGLASVCHQLCLNACRAAGVRATVLAPRQLGTAELEAAVVQYASSAADSLRARFDSAFLQKKKRTYNNGELILRAMSQLNADGATHNDLITQIRKRAKDYPPGNLTTYARELCGKDRGEILRYDESSRRYSFADPLYRTYAVCILKQLDQSRESSRPESKGQQRPASGTQGTGMQQSSEELINLFTKELLVFFERHRQTIAPRTGVRETK